MSALQAILTCYRKYCTFHGRATRPEFWSFLAFVLVTILCLRLIDLWIFGFDPLTRKPARVLSRIFEWASFLPLLAAAWRRMHDVALPGWYVLAPIFLTTVAIYLLISGMALFAVFAEVPDTSNTPYLIPAISLLLYLVASAAMTVWIVLCLAKSSVEQA